MDISFTRYGFIGDIDRLEAVTMPWSQFVTEFSTHVRLTNKMYAPGFGPYVLTPTETPCAFHKDKRIRVKAHRCDECVKEMTLAVFDVDTGTQDAVSNCDDSLGRAGLSRLWYSSYSYSPEQERPSMRLVLPFASPLNPKEWQSVRAVLIYQYGIPCLVSACKGKSHLYFIPSCSPESSPIAFATTGVFLNHYLLPKVQERKATSRSVSMTGWEPPEEPEPGTPIDMEPFRRVISSRRNYFNKGTPDRKYKALLLSRVLDGTALEGKGKRNDAMSIVCGIIAYALFETPVSVLIALLRPSLVAMQVEGSSLNEDEVRRMLLSAMRKKAESEEASKRFISAVDEAFSSIKSSVPVIPEVKS